MSVAPSDRSVSGGIRGWMRRENETSGRRMAQPLQTSAIVFGLAVAGLLTSCSAPAQAVAQRCAGSQLKVEVLRLAPEGYKRVQVRITNKTAFPCVLQGNPRVLLTDGVVSLNLPVVYASDKLPKHTPSSVLLRPNDSALVALSQARCPGRVTARALGLVVMPGRGHVSVRSDRLHALGVCDADANISSLGIGDFFAG